MESKITMSGVLYVVATPVGNLQDITERAKSTLASVYTILCEDTRVTAKLLNTYQIKKPLVSYHQYSESKREGEILKRLLDGENLALVSDAGTPTISDPGSWLIKLSVEKGIKVVPIPGPSALIAALSVSGFSADE